MRTETIYLYENRKDVTLTTYILDDSPDLLNGRTRPAVVICPGGGYFSCSDTEAEPVAMKFVSMGYHAFVLRYSVYGMDAFMNLGPQLPIKEHCQYPNAMREIGQAFLIIHENRKEWLVDTDRIAVCGFSAGAHNASRILATGHFLRVRFGLISGRQSRPKSSSKRLARPEM